MKQKLIIFALALYLSPSIYGQRSRFSEECIIDSLKRGHIYLSGIYNMAKVKEITYDLLESAQNLQVPLTAGQIVFLKLHIQKDDPKDFIEMVKLPAGYASPLQECIIDSIKRGHIYLTGVRDNIRGKTYDILSSFQTRDCTFTTGDVVLLRVSMHGAFPEPIIEKIKVPCRAMSPCRTIWQQVE